MVGWSGGGLVPVLVGGHALACHQDRHKAPGRSTLPPPVPTHHIRIYYLMCIIGSRRKITVGAADAAPVEFFAANGAFFGKGLEFAGGEEAPPQVGKIDWFIGREKCFIEQSCLGQGKYAVSSQGLLCWIDWTRILIVAIARGVVMPPQAGVRLRGGVAHGFHVGQVA